MPSELPMSCPLRAEPGQAALPLGDSWRLHNAEASNFDAGQRGRAFKYGWNVGPGCGLVGVIDDRHLITVALYLGENLLTYAEFQ